jgi:hypothetical protein
MPNRSGFSELRVVIVLAALLIALPARADVQCNITAPTLEDLRARAQAVHEAQRRASESRTPLPARAAWMSVDELRASPALRTNPSARANGGALAEEGAWQPGFGLPSLDRYALTAIEYHDELIVAGSLRSAGSVEVDGIARWTRDGWASLGNDVGYVSALTILDDRLIVGSFDGTVWAWDGRTWTRFPENSFIQLEAVTVHDNRIVAAGGMGGQSGRVLMFDGQQWTPLGADFDDVVTSVGVFRGELIAGGRFLHSGGTTCAYVARWDGASWVALGAGIDIAAYGEVGVLREYKDRLIVGGWLESCSGVPTPGLASWDGQQWGPLAGAPRAAYVYDVLDQGGRLYVAGQFEGSMSSVVVWDGSTLIDTEPLWPWTVGLAQFGSRLAAVGGFTTAGLCPASRSVVSAATLGEQGWDGLERWDPTMHGLASNVGAAMITGLTVYRGDIIASGDFQLAGAPPSWGGRVGVVRWDGGQWHELGSGLSCYTSVARVVGADLIVAGGTIGTSPEGFIHGAARWDGAQWHPMGQGLDGLVFALAEYKGRIYAGGEIRVGATGKATTLAVWNGVEWSEVPGAPDSAVINTARVYALEVHQGLLYVGGTFEGSGDIVSPNVLAWDGAAWHAVGAGVPGEVRALQSYQGELYAGGSLFHDQGSWDGLARWDGTSWRGLGLRYEWVSMLGRYGSKLLVGGWAIDDFAPGSKGLVTWDGKEWRGFGTGLNGTPLASCQRGADLFVGGDFSRAGDQPSFGIAQWTGPAPVPDPSVSRVAMSARSVVATGDVARISYSLPQPGRARLVLFDVTGARVVTLFDGEFPAGQNDFEWQPGSPAAYPKSGVYFLLLTSGQESASAKIVFAR